MCLGLFICILDESSARLMEFETEKKVYTIRTQLGSERGDSLVQLLYYLVSPQNSNRWHWSVGDSQSFSL